MVGWLCPRVGSNAVVEGMEVRFPTIHPIANWHYTDWAAWPFFVKIMINCTVITGTESVLKDNDLASNQKLSLNLCNSKLYSVFTTFRHVYLSQARLIQSSLFILRYILILSSHLRLGLPGGLVSFPAKTLCSAILPHACHVPLPSHPLDNDDPNIMG